MSRENEGFPAQPDPKPARPASTIRLAEIPHLTELTNFLNEPFDWDMLNQTAQTNRIFKNFNRNLSRTRDLVSGNVVGALVEQHVNQLLKKAQQSSQADEFPGELQIPSHIQNDNFRFIKTQTGGFKVHKKMINGKYHPHIEIDGLVIVDDMPVVLEIKAGATKSAIQKSTREERLAKIGEALNEAYPDKGFGFIFLLPPDNINPESHIQNQFKAKGGTFIPLGATSHDIIRNVQRLATERGISYVDTTQTARRRNNPPQI